MNTQIWHCHFKRTAASQKNNIPESFRVGASAAAARAAVTLSTSPTWIRRSRLCRERPRLCSRELPAASSWTSWRKENKQLHSKATEEPWNSSDSSTSSESLKMTISIIDYFFVRLKWYWLRVYLLLKINFKKEKPIFFLNLRTYTY